VDPGRDRRVEDILHLSCENLHRQGRARQQQAASAPAPLPVLEAGEDPGHPGKRAEIGKVSGVDMRKDRPAQGQDQAAQSGRKRMQPARHRPSAHAPAEDEQMDQQGEIDRAAKRQDQEDEVGRVEYRRLKSS
jgi:hypothetical protein